MSSVKSPSSVVTLQFRPPALRWLLLLPVLVALLGAWFSVRWYVGDTIAEYAPPVDDGGLEMAQMAVRWAPGDPLTHWRLATFEMKNFNAANVAAAVAEYQLAVKASPYDYRYWMELGRALESAGDVAGGEKALRHAVELAPSYAHPKWLYGNLLLRQGRTDEAFAELSAAAEADPLMRPAVFGLANQVYGSDVEKSVKVLPTPIMRLQYAMNLVINSKFDEARRVIRTISVADQKAQREIVDELMKEFVTRKQFHAALEILRQVESDSQPPAPEQVWNGSFESEVPTTPIIPFYWLIETRPQAQTTIDQRGHNSSRCLKISFRAPNKLERISVSQTITVAPDTSYRLQFYQRTEKLVGAATPFITINDEVNGGALAMSQPVPAGTSDWQLVTVEFRTKPKSDGIAIVLTSGSCSDPKEICPLFGSVWYDDFNLQRISGPSPARKVD